MPWRPPLLLDEVGLMSSCPVLSLAATELFKRTVALVTAPGAALSAMPFMPRGAFVILLEPQDLPSDGLRRKREVPLYTAEVIGREQEVMRAVRGLARAAGLNLAIVACPVELAGSDGVPVDAPQLVCGTQPIADAVSWAASRVFTWRNLPGPGGSPTPVGLADTIPGSGLRSKEAVDEFREWQECVSTRGSWVRDPYPRSLPWPYEGIYQGGPCDEQAGYLSGDEAKSILAQWRAGNKSALPDWERIRPGLRYYWSVDFKACHGQAVPKHWQWQEGNFIHFCDLIPGKKRHLVFIGDSLQDQMVADMVRRQQPLVPEKARAEAGGAETGPGAGEAYLHVIQLPSAFCRGSMSSTCPPWCPLCVAALHDAHGLANPEPRGEPCLALYS